MKKITLLVVVTLTLTLAPLGTALAASLSSPVNSNAGLMSALALSIGGELFDESDSDVGVQIASQVQSSEQELELHPAQLSLPGEVVEDVLQPRSGAQKVSGSQSSPLACR